jgi:hypothetical protein
VSVPSHVSIFPSEIPNMELNYKYCKKTFTTAYIDLNLHVRNCSWAARIIEWPVTQAPLSTFGSQVYGHPLEQSISPPHVPQMRANPARVSGTHAAIRITQPCVAGTGLGHRSSSSIRLGSCLLNRLALPCPRANVQLQSWMQGNFTQKQP